MGARVGRRLYYGFLARNCLNTPDPETQLTESYPAQLSVLLGGDEWDVRNFGKGGRTVVDIEGRAYRDASAYEEALTWGDDGFEVLIICLGIDNCSNDEDQGADIYRIVGSTPNYQPTRKPTGGGGECADDLTWSYGTKASNTCAYVGQKVKPDGTLARCKEKNTDGERSALEACPRTCGTCP